MSKEVIITLTEDTTANYPGLAGLSFKIYVNFDLLIPGCRIHPVGYQDELLIIQDKPEAWNKGFRQSVKYVTDDHNKFFPPELLKKDCEFVYAGHDFPNLKPWEMWILNT